MESLAFAEKKIPRKDLVTGIGTSFLVHILIFTTAVMWAWIMPHTPLKPPYCTVNLVSLKDLGVGSSEPKGSPKAAEEAVVSENRTSSARTSRKPAPAAPIKRLAVDEPVTRPETQIKKIEPKEVPKTPEKPESLEAIEKNLDKLIAKPKVVPHTSSAVAERVEPQPKTAAHPAQAPAPANEQPGNGKTARGTPTGTVEGGAKGTVQGSVIGSPDGSGSISSAALLYYERVRNAIKREWRFPEQNVGNLEAKVTFVVSRDGQVLSVQIEKPSGNSLFDDSTVRAIRKAEIPAMPAVMEGSKKDIRIVFTPQGVS